MMSREGEERMRPKERESYELELRTRVTNYGSVLGVVREPNFPPFSRRVRIGQIAFALAQRGIM
jgi:hypothetical protein